MCVNGKVFKETTAGGVIQREVKLNYKNPLSFMGFCRPSESLLLVKVQWDTQDVMQYSGQPVNPAFLS